VNVGGGMRRARVVVGSSIRSVMGGEGPLETGLRAPDLQLTARWISARLSADRLGSVVLVALSSASRAGTPVR